MKVMCAMSGGVDSSVAAAELIAAGHEVVGVTMRLWGGAYLLARAVQFFLPGVPQVYYVGLLAGENDMALLQRTGVGRDINRHHFSAREVEDALHRPVVKALVALIRARSTHPAFSGHFALDAGDNTQQLSMSWISGEHTARLRADFATLEYTVEFSG